MHRVKNKLSYFTDDNQETPVPTLPKPIADAKTLEKVGDILHTLMLQDNRISFLFKHVNMDALRRKQVWFFTSLAMGTSESTHDYMRHTHQKLVRDFGLAEEHFNALMECLAQALETANMDPETSERMLDQAAKLKPHILGEYYSPTP
jgi:hemoglobin